ncbi:hypothetical protein CXX84_01075 [Arthrobacter sp. AFG7.2]|nr:hypothetical protein CXX84_01075 [Arthrobacter sp. AFG7.2]
MSRSRPRASQVYGMVVLRCPDGHQIGRVMRRNTGRYSIVDGLFASKDYKRQPLSVRCVRCEGVGKFRDLRGSWEKVFALADELQVSTRVNVQDYLLGG